MFVVGSNRLPFPRNSLISLAQSPEQVSERTGLVSDAGKQHDAVVHHLVGPMVVMAFETLRAAQHSPTSRAELVTHLQQRFGSDIKIVHGAADGHFGLYGGDTSWSYTFTFPGFDTALATLGGWSSDR